MTLLIRRAAPADVPAVTALALETVGASLSSLRLAPLAEVRTLRAKDLEALPQLITMPQAAIFVAAGGSQEPLLGYAIVMTHVPETTTGEAQAWLFDLAVQPAAARKGIGRALLGSVEAFCREQGMAYLGAEITCGNGPMETLMERLGFVEERKKMLAVLARTPVPLRRSSRPIRVGTLEDVEPVRALAVESVEHSVSPLRRISAAGVRAFRTHDLDTLDQALALEHFHMLVAEDGAGWVAGHCFLMTRMQDTATGETQAWIYDLAVAPDHWGRGIGTDLVGRAMEIALAEGSPYLGLAVTSANARAVAFYHRLGFAVERRRVLKVLE